MKSLPVVRRRLVIVITVIALMLFGLNRVHVSTYEILPGQASPLSPMIKVSGVPTDPQATTKKSGFMMVDVALRQMTALSQFWAQVRGATNTVLLSDLVSKGSSFADFDRQSYLDMQNSKDNAELNAFRALGWSLTPQPTGAVTTDFTVGSAARKAGLRIADRIVSINGSPIANSCDAIAALHDVAPASTVQVGIEKAKVSDAGVITYAEPTMLKISTKKTPRDVAVSDCPGITTIAKSWIGVSLSDGVSYNFPATITINTQYIGGPSAGLAMTLALIDHLSEGSLSGGKKVAVTGEIATNGTVGDIGGIEQKTAAAITAGAAIFIVPANQAYQARAAAHGKLAVIGATKLAQVLRELRRLGGQPPVPYTKPNF